MRHMLRQCAASVTVLGAMLWANGACAALIVLGDNAASVNQVDFRGPAINSSLGQLTINIANANAAASLSSGYINVADSSGNWLVRNLPLLGSATYDNPTITVNFPIGVSDGTLVSTKSLKIDYSAAPSVSFSGGPTSAFTVGHIGLAQGGVGTSLSGYLGTANPALANFTLNGLVSGVYQKNHPNQQSADDQCAPIGIANSLTWLKDTQGLPVPDPNNIGLKGDNLLVGKLDTLMGRGVRTRADGDGVQPIDILKGKLTYVGNAGLAGKVVTKHQGLLGGADVMASNGQVSYGKGAAVDINFIINELMHGEDVEMAFFYPDGQGHMVDITGAGFILGVPWITYVSDHLQSDVDLTDTMGTGMVDFSFLKGNTLLNEPGQPVMAFLVTESLIPEPSTLALLAIAVAILLSKRKAQEGRVAA